MKKSSKPSVQEAFDRTKTRLQNAGVSNAIQEARELVASVLACRPMNIFFQREKTLTPDRRRLLESRVRKRCGRVPLAYVLGEWDFCGLRFFVNQNVLIPRPETEELAAWAMDSLRGTKAPRVADVGTGSGCLAVVLAKEFPASRVWAVDVSSRALDVARKNAALHRTAERIDFLEGDLLAPLERARLALDAVVANLPYVDSGELNFLASEVRCEPALALDGGGGGLDVIRRLLPQAYGLLKPGGKIFLETGYDQASKAAREMRAAGFSKIDVKKDFAGIPRFLSGAR